MKIRGMLWVGILWLLLVNILQTDRGGGSEQGLVPSSQLVNEQQQ